MHPTRLNLLPPDKQRYLQRMVFVQFVKSTLETILILICVVGMALLGGQWLMQGYFNSLAESSLSASSFQGVKSAQIREVNVALKKAQFVQRDYILWTPLLIELGNAIPEGVYLTTYAIDRTTNTFQFSGIAASRESFLALQQSLTALPYIDSIEIPVSHLTQQENIQFNLSTQLNL